MSGNKSRKLTQQTSEISRHLELVQPRTKTSTTTTLETTESEPIATVEEREKIRQKIRVNAAKRPGVVQTRALRKSALMPVDGGMSMGMGGGNMDVD